MSPRLDMPSRSPARVVPVGPKGGNWCPHARTCCGGPRQPFLARKSQKDRCVRASPPLHICRFSAPTRETCVRCFYESRPRAYREARDRPVRAERPGRRPKRQKRRLRPCVRRVVFARHGALKATFSSGKRLARPSTTCPSMRTPISALGTNRNHSSRRA